MKDAEIQRLQSSLQEKQAEDQSGVIENLRTDLQNMIEKNQRSERNYNFSITHYQIDHCIKVVRSKHTTDNVHVYLKSGTEDEIINLVH